MKKVLISTYCHWTSYGSMLQSLGLQMAVKALGAEAITVTFAEDNQIPAVKKLRFRFSSGTINDFFRLMNKSKLESGRKRCFDFMDRNIQRITVTSKEHLSDELPDADVYIAGSDQIWHPALCRKDFFLDYAPKEKKRISYAASMGMLTIPEMNETAFSDLMKNLDSISVREADMIPVIQKYSDQPIMRHIDPTFLVSADDWRKLESEYIIKQPYILVYALYWDRKLNRELKMLQKKTGCRIVSIQNSIRPIYANQTVMDAGPAEFLWLIDHAWAVITSSFHGTAFSVIFNKRFYPVVNPGSPSRIDNLLKILKVQTAPSINALSEDFTDYSEVNSNIAKEAARSAEYLRRAISDEE